MSNEALVPKTVIDARGLQCPMPLVRASQAIQSAEVGDIVQVLATDRGSVPDFQAWIKNRPQFALLKQDQDTSGDRTVYVHYLTRLS